MKSPILIIDDHLKVYKSLARNFQYLGYQTLHARNSAEAIKLFSEESVGVVLLDIMLGGESGIELLKDFFVQHEIPVIMITGHGSIDTAVQAMKLGAFDYVTKPLDFDRLLEIVAQAADRAPNTEKTAAKQPEPASMRMVTQNKHMLALCEKARKLAVTNLPVLITGEDGTGKELIADFIHRHSSRHAQKIHKTNCAAFPENLLDNELFGHEKGSYTGADATFKGVFERADGSSLFLDEIGDMPLTIQAKILRTLQQREIRRIGGDRTITVDVRFIAATNKDLPDQIAQKSFRKDFFYRLNTAVLHVPALRQRKDDIPLLVEYFLAEFARGNAVPAKQMHRTIFELFVDYNWPGNVRELKNAVHYAAAISSGAEIMPADLPPHFSLADPSVDSENIRADTERDLILKMLQKTNYNKAKTARLLKMSRNTLYNKLERYGLATSKPI